MQLFVKNTVILKVIESTSKPHEKDCREWQEIK